MSTSVFVVWALKSHRFRCLFTSIGLQKHLLTNSLDTIRQLPPKPIAWFFNYFFYHVFVFPRRRTIAATVYYSLLLFFSCFWSTSWSWRLFGPDILGEKNLLSLKKSLRIMMKIETVSTYFFVVRLHGLLGEGWPKTRSSQNSGRLRKAWHTYPGRNCLRSWTLKSLLQEPS